MVYFLNKNKKKIKNCLFQKKKLKKKKNQLVPS